MEAGEGRTDEETHEEGQDKGVRQGEYIIMVVSGERKGRGYEG